MGDFIFKQKREKCLSIVCQKFRRKGGLQASLRTGAARGARIAILPCLDNLWRLCRRGRSWRIPVVAPTPHHGHRLSRSPVRTCPRQRSRALNCRLMRQFPWMLPKAALHPFCIMFLSERLPLVGKRFDDSGHRYKLSGSPLKAGGVAQKNTAEAVQWLRP